MKFQLGDPILIRKTEEEGKIVAFLGKNMAEVNVAGVVFPIHEDELDFPYRKWFTTKKEIPAKKGKVYVDDIKREKKIEIAREEDGVRMNFLPVYDTDEFGDEYVKYIKLYLLNNLHDDLHFTYKLKQGNNILFDIKNIIHSFKEFYLHDVPFSEIVENPQFFFDFSLVKPNKKKERHFESILRKTAKNIFLKIEECKAKDEATFSFLLFTSFPEKKEAESLDLQKLEAKGYTLFDAGKGKVKQPAIKHEVDLHIEKLTDEYNEMTNAEKLDLQLSTFENYLEIAIARGQKKFTVIHGVGEGILKNEVHKILASKKEVERFENSYDVRYGAGATFITFYSY